MITIFIVITNLIGLSISFLYGKFGGPGGQTTEGVFLGIKITGFCVVLLCLLFSVFVKGWFTKYWYLIILLLGFGLLQLFFQELLG